MQSPLLILDTHVWIWLNNKNSEQLSPACLETIYAAERLGLSIISVWEVGMLESKGRLRFNTSCQAWVQAALNAPRLSLLPLSPEIALESSYLPGEIHGDPADRLLAATCRTLGASLVTRDKQLQEYGQQGFIDILEA